MKIDKIQKYLTAHQLDGWLLADVHGRNEIAMEMLGISTILTRRSFFFIPAAGEPTVLVTPIEAVKFANAPGKTIICHGYSHLEAELARLLDGCRKVAMEFSAQGRFPMISLVDSGTIDLVRSLRVEVVSSADLLSDIQARLTPEQIAMHRIAARNLIEIKDAAFVTIGDALENGREITEFDVCRLIRDKLESYDMVTESGPSCSVGPHAGDPHYEPEGGKSAAIQKGQLILVDLWGRIKLEGSIYADITWMAFTGGRSEIPDRYVELFSVVADARDAVIEFLRDNPSGRPIAGCEVDDLCRNSIAAAGWERQFTHRTGHSITTTVHGPGPNLDNYESEDCRLLQDGHLFSVEPGVYFDDCGFRTEIDCLIGKDGLEITTLPLQSEITPLF